MIVSDGLTESVRGINELSPTYRPSTPCTCPLRSVAERRGLTRKPIVVVNGSEGEPASSKYAVLLTRHPHLVLDGALFVANADHAPRLDAPKPTDPHIRCRQ